MKFGILILSGGSGKRMNSNLPKVLHKLNGKCLLQHVINVSKKLNPESIGIIVGEHSEQIQSEINDSEIEYILQESPKGTGHALQCAEEFIKRFEKVLVLSGDVPLITEDTLNQMINTEADCTLLVNDFEDPTGYGRIIINSGKVSKVSVIEEKDCTCLEREIKEVNSGIYCFKSEELLLHLYKLECNNAQSEYYLTDLIPYFDSVILVKTENNFEIKGINTKEQFDELNCIKGKKILIIGGTGSLGNKLTETYINDNELYLYSRDESKHWAMNIEYNNNSNLNFIIGNIKDKSKIRQTLIRHNFDIIILAAALKHIDRCEYESNECIDTNLHGTQIVLNEIENNMKLLTNLKKVCFISTDKACSPINIYGMSKAISESLMVEKSKYIKNIKFVCVRYGNVLNSRGSIIPMLHKIGENENIKEFKLTDPRMTRFVMTLEQSVKLIQHALIYAESGDIVIPKLISCTIKDLIEIFSDIYNKPIIEDKLRPGEKMLESLINETQSMRLKFGQDGYMYIKPPYKNFMVNNDIKDYNSTINPLNKEELKKYLNKLNLI